MENIFDFFINQRKTDIKILRTMEFPRFRVVAYVGNITDQFPKSHLEIVGNLGGRSKALLPQLLTMSEVKRLQSVSWCDSLGNPTPIQTIHPKKWQAIMIAHLEQLRDKTIQLKIQSFEKELEGFEKRL
jgi:hypothetical protein